MNKEKERLLSSILKSANIVSAGYYAKQDCFAYFDSDLNITRKLPSFLSRLEQDFFIHPEDVASVKDFMLGRTTEPIEFRLLENGIFRNKITGIPQECVLASEEKVLVFTLSDITHIREEARALAERAERDPLTGLYNQTFGKKYISEYLKQKAPYTSCGIMLIDIDYFKNVNDNFGHMFGDHVLISFANFLQNSTYPADIVMRAGGDEFVILFKDITHATLLKKAMQLVSNVQRIDFPGYDYSLTCSIGVCFLPENISGFTYEQLFNNADWALYRAKENGRNRYVFCDNLNRYENTSEPPDGANSDIDTRYLHNDIISTAFEIFEKTNNFETALRLLLRIIGLRYRLDRITILQTDLKNRTTSRQYQWCSEYCPEVLETPASFSKEDFLTLYHSYDDYGTVVLHPDSMDKYSPAARKLLIQGDAKTVVYAAMYSEGTYIGAISYVDNQCRRFWSRQDRATLGELTKVIAAYLTRKQSMNSHNTGILSAPDYDSLTGLLSFSRFREEVEKLIVGKTETVYAMIYCDILQFKLFNNHYGYETGDMLLKALSAFIMEKLELVHNAYVTRVISDQFIIFMPMHYADIHELEKQILEFSNEFSLEADRLYPDAGIRIRSGLYRIPEDCTSAARAIDAANYARYQAGLSIGSSTQVYDEHMTERQRLREELADSFRSAMNNGEFKVYLQPRVSLKDRSIIGAEAFIRWERPDGTILTPNVFLSLFEETGHIAEIDFFVCEQVVALLARNRAQGRKQIPISVNASILHAKNEGTVEHYLNILKKYNIPPSLLEIELGENVVITYYNNVKYLFECLQKEQILTSLDDYGSSYSRLNTLIDLPVNTVKLDRLFFSYCLQHENGSVLLEQIIRLSKSLGYHVVCEGIETKEQAELVTAAGCEEGQGLYFSMPLPLDEFEKLL